MDNNNQSEFITGGTLKADYDLYVERPADTDLYNRAIRGEFCYVLTARQMGKSSLMVRVRKKLEEQGVKTAVVDLTQVGANNIDAEQWYRSILDRLKSQLNLDVDLEKWWESNKDFAQVNRFTNFLRDEILAKIDQRIVIFVDEIDSTLDLDFSDNFFSAIRATYNLRATEHQYNRLSFVLLGVATPQDLIQDVNTTPFNIGAPVNLAEFSLKDASALLDNLEKIISEDGKAAFARIFHWTNGHPYLTQRICAEITKKPEHPWLEKDVDNLVNELFLSETSASETNIEYIRNYIQKHDQKKPLLSLYKRVYSGESILENERSQPQNRLRVIGLLGIHNNHLIIRNEIYRGAFNQKWINLFLPTKAAEKTPEEPEKQKSPRLPRKLFSRSFWGLLVVISVVILVALLILSKTSLFKENTSGLLPTNTQTPTILATEVNTPLPIVATATIPQVTIPPTESVIDLVEEETPEIIETAVPIQTATNSVTPSTLPSSTISPTIEEVSPTNTPLIPTNALQPSPPPPSPTNLNFVCNSDPERFHSSQQVNFEWDWAGNLANGEYLEIRVGPRGGNLSSIGKVPTQPQGTKWSWIAPATLFFDANYYDYEWQVAHMTANQRTIVASAKGCIHVEP
ncbi:MAG: AAA-like domain-containing protein [Flavobacteriales bacterium]|nr:AAA-like domain-containing protein [Flavobacteriales bacterium]